MVSQILSPVNLFLLGVPLALAKPVLFPRQNQTCKAAYTTPDWPSTSSWEQLNSTLNGKLLAPLPEAIVCDNTKPEYNAAACSAVDATWTNLTYTEASPLTLQSINYQNDSCLPPSLYDVPGSCNLAPYAKYVVNASTPEDVQAAVKFAGANNLQLSIKNTGHDYLGRSTSPGFQLYTYHLTGIQMIPQFQAQSCPNVTFENAIQMHSGNQYGEAYAYAKAHNRVFAGGSDASVGVGGHSVGGGHSPLGSYVGLMVDNVLEMTVVTPDGELLTANECQNSDLFWAMRGGGGSTFGVLVSTTVKTYADVPAAFFTLSFTSTDEEAANNNNTNFWNLLASMHIAAVDWSDRYVNGYYYWGTPALLPAATALLSSVGNVSEYNITNQGANPTVPITYSFSGWGLNQSIAQLNATMWAFAEEMNATEGITGSLVFTAEGTAANILQSDISQKTSGRNFQMGSRLWDRPAMQDRTGLIQTFREIGNNYIFGIFVSGPAVRNHALDAVTSVTPAWRNTYLHLIVGTRWQYGNSTAQAEAREVQNELTALVQAHAPNTGSYMNEGDVAQPDAPQAFWGDNYDRLVQLKQKYDPNGMFWCKPCIGWQDWTMNWSTGQLCRN